GAGRNPGDSLGRIPDFMTSGGFWGDWYRYGIFNGPHGRGFALLLGQIDAPPPRITGAQVTRIEARDHMGSRLSHGMDSPCRRIGAISQHYFSRPETMTTQLLASGIIRQLDRPESACARINLNMSSPLHGLSSRTIDHRPVHYADRPSTGSLR